MPDEQPPDAPRHVGTHHYARCGEWRPTAGNRECQACAAKCPACGKFYNQRET